MQTEIRESRGCQEKQLILLFVLVNSWDKTHGQIQVIQEEKRMPTNQKKKDAECWKGSPNVTIEKATVAREDKFYYCICKQSVSCLRICSITRTICFLMSWVEAKERNWSARWKIESVSIERNEFLYKENRRDIFLTFTYTYMHGYRPLLCWCNIHTYETEFKPIYA